MRWKSGDDMARKHMMDMTNGTLFSKLILFSLPLIASGILQLLFHAADIIVVGRFAGANSMAAVGSTTSLVNLLTNFFIGISIGANVVLGRYIGARNYAKAQESVHTAMCTALVCGIFVMVLGLLLSPLMLKLMDTPSDVIELSTLYLRIYFCGMPFFMLYNYGAALLRSVGDTRRPLYFLTVAGVVNVILNLIFVIVLHMDVAGVALATITSQAISAWFVMQSLKQSQDFLHFTWKDLSLKWYCLKEMLVVGLPAGLQSIVFSLSNVIIQSSINSFGSVVMAGNTAASNIEGFIFTSTNSLHQTALSFTAQNYGAKKPKRITKTFLYCLVIVSTIGLVMGIGSYLLGNLLLGIYSSDPIVIEYGLQRLSIVAISYCLCGIMDVCAAAIRGIGYSFMPMIVSMIGACAFRIIWIVTIFQWYRSIETLYISYPISWILTIIIHLCCYFIVRKKAYRKLMED